MSASLTTREMEARTTMRCHLPCLEWLSSHQKRQWRRQCGKGTLVHGWWELTLGQLKRKHRATPRPSSPTYGNTPEGQEITSLSSRTPVVTAMLFAGAERWQQPQGTNQGNVTHT